MTRDDEQHLHVLTVLHYVYSVLVGSSGCFPLLYVLFGVFILVSPPETWGKEPPPPPLGWIMVVFGGLAMLMLWAKAVVVLLAGRDLAARRRHTFCLVIAAIECLFVPLGTALGVFTLVVLLRPGVKEAFTGTGPRAETWVDTAEPRG